MTFVFIITIFVTIFFISFFLFKFFATKFYEISPKIKQDSLTIIDTMDLVKNNIKNIFECVKNKKWSHMKNFCTDCFLKKTNNGKVINIDYNINFDYIIEQDKSNEVIVMIVGKCYEIRSNKLKFIRNQDNQLKLEEIT